jgi:hypothetical protein
MTLRERVLSRLIIDPSGCLLWTGATTAGGYGVVGVGNKIEYIHRLMYRWFVDLIPDDHQIDHLCRVRHCGSPADLEAVTQRVNTLRGTAPSAINAAATHCLNGHEFDLLNTYYRPDRTGRQCRTCRRARQDTQRALHHPDTPRGDQ